MSEEAAFIPPTLEELAALLPNYTFIDMIAAGGMGAVYEATQTALDRRVAIKVLPREFYADEEFRESFAREAKAMAKLNHPNLIGVYDFGEVDQLQYIVMEFVAGQALHYSIYQQQVDPKEAIRIVQEVCSGMQSAHEAGLLHRDIKPANILLDESATSKIGDFGLARATEGDESGTIFGTPGYVAPEVLNAPDQVGPATDVYAIGAMLYEMLSGETPPHEGSPPSAAAKCQCDRRLDIIIAKATHPNLSQRYSSAAELSAELDAIKNSLAQSRSLAVAAPAAARAPRAAASPPPTRRPAVTQEDSGSGNIVRNLIIIAVLLGAIVGVLQLIQDRDIKNEQKLAQAAEEKATAEQEKKARLQEREAERLAAATAAAEKDEEEEPVEEPTPLTGSTKAQLNQLEDALAAGDRSVFPTESIRVGNSVFLGIERNMTWYEARDYAARFGARLAVVASNRLKTSAAKVAQSEPSWVGASVDGNGAWMWLDRQKFEWEGVPVVEGQCVTLDRSGFFGSASAGEKRPFVIEWTMDGQDADDPAERLDGANTVDIAAGTYPVGTMKFNRHRYLYISGDKTWFEARNTARQLGGHLASPSSAEEMGFLRNHLIKALPLNHRVWLGLYASKGQWSWVDGNDAGTPAFDREPLATNRFGSFIFETELKLVAAKGNQPANGFLVEWDAETSDQGAEVPETEEVTALEADPALLAKLENLQQIRQTHYDKRVAERDTGVAEVVASLDRSFDSELGRMSTNARKAAKRRLQSVRQNLKKGIAPGDLRQGLIERMPSEFLRYYQRAAKETNVLRIATLDALIALESGYLIKLNELMEESNDDKAMQDRLLDEVERTRQSRTKLELEKIALDNKF